MGDFLSGCCCSGIAWSDLFYADGYETRDAIGSNPPIQYSFYKYSVDSGWFHDDPTLYRLVRDLPGSVYENSDSTILRWTGTSDHNLATVNSDEEFTLWRESSAGGANSKDDFGFYYDVQRKLETLAASSVSVPTASTGDVGQVGWVGIQRLLPLEGGDCILMVESYIAAGLVNSICWLDANGSAGAMITGTYEPNGDSTEHEASDPVVPDIPEGYQQYVSANWNKVSVGYSLNEIVRLTHRGGDRLVTKLSSTGTASNDKVVINATGATGITGISGYAQDDEGDWVIREEGSTDSEGDFYTIVNRRRTDPHVATLMGPSHPKCISVKCVRENDEFKSEYYLGEIDDSGNAADSATTDTLIFEGDGEINSFLHHIHRAEEHGGQHMVVATYRDFADKTTKRRIMHSNGSVEFHRIASLSSFPYATDISLYLTTQALYETQTVTEGGLTWAVLDTSAVVNSQIKYTYFSSTWGAGCQVAMFKNGSGKTSDPDQADFVVMQQFRRTIGENEYYGVDLLFYKDGAVIAVKRSPGAVTPQNFHPSTYRIHGCSDRYVYASIGNNHTYRFRRDGKAQDVASVIVTTPDGNAEGGGTGFYWNPVRTSVEDDNTAIPWDAVDSSLGPFDAVQGV